MRTATTQTQQLSKVGSVGVFQTQGVATAYNPTAAKIDGFTFYEPSGPAPPVPKFRCCGGHPGVGCNHEYISTYEKAKPESKWKNCSIPVTQLSSIATQPFTPSKPAINNQTSMIQSRPSTVNTNKPTVSGVNAQNSKQQPKTAQKRPFVSNTNKPTVSGVNAQNNKQQPKTAQKRPIVSNTNKPTVSGVNAQNNKQQRVIVLNANKPTVSGVNAPNSKQQPKIAQKRPIVPNTNQASVSGINAPNSKQQRVIVSNANQASVSNVGVHIKKPTVVIIEPAPKVVRLEHNFNR